MGIVFICSCLEYGKDGVGDYTRRLAAVLIKQGIWVGIIALNDRQINENFDGVQMNEGVAIKVLRLSANNTYQQRVTIAKSWITTANPEWLSLQYVPFGFNKKGLPFGLAKHLGKLGKGKKWHVMFHELWVGMDEECAIKLKVWGLVQKQLIQLMIKKLKPLVVNTHTQLYKQHLQLMGTNAGLLPLFSNIPVAAQNNSGIKDKNRLHLILFGNIQLGTPVQQFAKEIAHWGKSKSVTIEVEFIGRNGSEGQNWRWILEAEGIATKRNDEEEPFAISTALQNADWGIVTTPVSVVGKSGSFAAMREHGLPVLCINRKWTPRAITVNNQVEGLFEYIPGLVEEILKYDSQKNTFKQKYTVYDAAEQLLQLLN